MEDNLLDELLSDEEKPKDISEALAEEMGYIQDWTIKEFVHSLLLKAPAAFWTGPASNSGKYHPPDERGVGGNLLHTRRVVRAVLLLGEAQERSQYQMDQLVAAAILHDLLKNEEWEDGTMHTNKMHMYTIDAFVEKARADDKRLASEGSPSTVHIEEVLMSEILRLIHCSHGIWSPIPETFPVTTMDWLLHFADNVAAKLHTLIDGENIVESRWNADPDVGQGD